MHPSRGDAPHVAASPRTHPSPGRRRTKDDDGASAVEYGLLVAGVAAVVSAAVFSFGGTVNSLFQDSCDTIAAAVGSTCGGSGGATPPAPARPPRSG